MKLWSTQRLKAWIGVISEKRRIQADAVSRHQISGEFGLLLTISTLMLGAVFGMMFAVSRDEIRAALSSDVQRCEQSGVTNCVRSYEAFIFLMGSICAEGCAAVMIYVMLMRFSLSLLNIRADDDKSATIFYGRHVSGIRFCYFNGFMFYLWSVCCHQRYVCENTESSASDCCL
jgi:hypothetical protein